MSTEIDPTIEAAYRQTANIIDLPEEQAVDALNSSVSPLVRSAYNDYFQRFEILNGTPSKPLLEDKHLELLSRAISQSLLILGVDTHLDNIQFSFEFEHYFRQYKTDVDKKLPNAHLAGSIESGFTLRFNINNLYWDFMTAIWGISAIRSTIGHEIHHFFTEYSYPAIAQNTNEENIIGGQVYADSLGEVVAEEYGQNFAAKVKKVEGDYLI
jgi:hypothetical protein